MRNQIGEALYTVRMSHGYTQQMLADAIGVKRNTVCSWEKGTREPDFETLEAIADTFNCSLYTLLGAADTRPNDRQNEPVPNPESGLTPDGVRLAEKIDRLSEESRRELEKYVDYLVSQAHQDT